MTGRVLGKITLSTGVGKTHTLAAVTRKVLRGGSHTPLSFQDALRTVADGGEQPQDAFPHVQIPAPHSQPVTAVLSSEAVAPPVLRSAGSALLSTQTTLQVGTEKRDGAGYQVDSRKRKAVELYAEDSAVAHYESQGWTVERIGKPYDLRCTRQDDLERHVEVKGTMGAPTSVVLTINEVEHARDPDNTVDLYVVSGIHVTGRDDVYEATSGTVTHRMNWEPSDEDLRPRTFEYRIPPE